jgi:hypothetical protein
LEQDELYFDRHVRIALVLGSIAIYTGQTMPLRSNRHCYFIPGAVWTPKPQRKHEVETVMLLMPDHRYSRKVSAEYKDTNGSVELAIDGQAGLGK